MEILSEEVIDLINQLHTEKLDYHSEYLPLIEAAQKLYDYEHTGLSPEEILPTVQEWIPVTEPPKENGEYLCWIFLNGVGERKEYGQKILYWEDNVWLESPRRFRMAHPLYWMPLPEPPKVGESDG